MFSAALAKGFSMIKSKDWSHIDWEKEAARFQREKEIYAEWLKSGILIQRTPEQVAEDLKRQSERQKEKYRISSKKTRENICPCCGESFNSGWNAKYCQSCKRLNQYQRRKLVAENADIQEKSQSDEA